MFVQKKRGPSEDDEQDDANELAWLRARSRPFSQPYGLGANGLAGLFLGGIGGAHAVLLVQSLAAPQRNVALVRWCLYACAMCGFHASEFLGAAAWRWRDVSFDSWLLNHSVAYGLAFFAAVLEFALEYRLPLKQSAATLRLGVVLVAGGQAVRLAALATCGEHFAHRVARCARPLDTVVVAQVDNEAAAFVAVRGHDRRLVKLVVALVDRANAVARRERRAGRLARDRFASAPRIERVEKRGIRFGSEGIALERLH